MNGSMLHSGAASGDSAIGVMALGSLDCLRELLRFLLRGRSGAKRGRSGIAGAALGGAGASSRTGTALSSSRSSGNRSKSLMYALGTSKLLLEYGTSRWALKVGDRVLLDGHEGNAQVRTLLLLVEAKENASHVLELELLVDEKELERDPEDEALDQPIDMGELDAFGEAMVVNKGEGEDNKYQAKCRRQKGAQGICVGFMGMRL